MSWNFFNDLRIYIYIYIVDKDSEYPMNECLMHGYLIQNIPEEPNIFCWHRRYIPCYIALWSILLKKLRATNFFFLFTVFLVINFVYFKLVTWFQPFEFYLKATCGFYNFSLIWKLKKKISNK